MKISPRLCLLPLVVGVLCLAAQPAQPSSHSDAPLIKQDPQANLTDVYAFIGTRYDSSDKVLNVVVNVRPFSEPGDGVIYDRFADDALYSIHLTHPITGDDLRRYDFRFSDVNPVTTPGLKNPGSILSYGVGADVGPILGNDDAHRNYTQAYGVQVTTGRRTRAVGQGLITAVPNLGRRTTPLYNDNSTGAAISGAITFLQLDPYTLGAIHPLNTGEVVFAGPREDGFYADTPAIFDLLDPRILDNNGNIGDGLGQDGNGVDGFKGFNVLTFAMQIPLEKVPHMEYTMPGLIGGAQVGCGVYASVSRPRVTQLSDKRDPSTSGPWIQVNRLGNPLVNEVLVALRDKDRYNRNSPTQDSRIVRYAEEPELGRLINAVYGTAFVTSGRADLKAILLGPGTGADVLRVNTATDPVSLSGQPGFSRLTFIGGDLAKISGVPSTVPGGWPNGRRLGDDVVDIALTAIASGPSYTAITLLGDNVAANDAVYNQVFPYAATPHAGARHSKDSGIND